jgi:hypothetical protein
LNVNRRKGIGGPAPETVRATIENQRTLIIEEEKRHQERLEKLKVAKNKLDQAEARLK